jgi:hypothetical protein
MAAEKTTRSASLPAAAPPATPYGGRNNGPASDGYSLTIDYQQKPLATGQEWTKGT